VGSLLGALLGGYVLFFWLDLDQVYLVALAAVVVAATLLTIQVAGLPRLAALAFVLVPALAGVVSMPRWDPMPFSSAAFRVRAPRAGDELGPKGFFAKLTEHSRVTFYDDDPNSSVAVRDTIPPAPPNPAIVTNGKPDGSIVLDYPTMALAGLIPALFTRQSEYAFVIGFGTGVTAGELAALDSMREVTIAEIAPAVIEAGRHFEAFNQGALGNPKTRVEVADAYRTLLRSSRQYDVIASEPSNPWVTGVEMLFSQEFLRAAKDKLRPGGVYAQWFHCYENDTSVVELVLRTYASVFDDVAVWYAFGPDLILLGFKDPDPAQVLDVGRLRGRFQQPDLHAGLGRAGIENFPALLAHELLPLGVVNAAALPGDVHTILHPVLSYRAGRAFFRGREAALPPLAMPAAAARGAERSLLRRFAATRGGRLDDVAHQQLVDEACKSRPDLCATLLAWWLAEVPDSQRRADKIAALRAHAVFRPHVGAAKLQSLASFYLRSADPSELEPTDAARYTDLFLDYYFHGAPFSRAALADIWQRCRGAGAGCEVARRRAERRLGPLEAPADAATGG
jgi:hypothetical protein